MTIDQALAKLLKALVFSTVAVFFVWASVDVVAPLGSVLADWLAHAGSVARDFFNPQIAKIGPASRA